MFKIILNQVLKYSPFENQPFTWLIFCLGLSSQQALNKLIYDISSELQKSCSGITDITNSDNENNLPKVCINWKLCFDSKFLAKTFGSNSQTSLFSWVALLASILHIVALFLCGGILLQVCNNFTIAFGKINKSLKIEFY